MSLWESNRFLKIFSFLWNSKKQQHLGQNIYLSAHSALTRLCQWKKWLEQKVQQGRWEDSMQLQSRSCHLVLLYHHLFLAWLTRTRRSNVFCLLLPAETTALYANWQEALVLSLVEASQVLLLLWQMHAVSHQRGLLQELIQHFAGKTDLYLPLIVTRLQTTQRFISVTSIYVIHVLFNHSAVHLAKETLKALQFLLF